MCALRKVIKNYTFIKKLPKKSEINYVVLANFSLERLKKFKKKLTFQGEHTRRYVMFLDKKQDHFLCSPFLRALIYTIFKISQQFRNQIQSITTLVFVPSQNFESNYLQFLVEVRSLLISGKKWHLIPPFWSPIFVHLP